MSTIPAVLFVDADNTLWDTNAIFADAQRQLLAEVATALGEAVPASDPLGFVRSVDQALAERHHSGLRYPPRLLIGAMELALTGGSAAAAAREAWKGRPAYRLSADATDRIEQRYLAALALPAQLRPGVAEGLERLRAAECSMLVISEGAKARVKRNIERLKLSRFFDRVIEAPKAPELYRRVLRLTGTINRAFMVGDQLDRDIVPAKAAGLETIWFPGGFHPKWSPSEHQARPDHVISSFAEIPPIVSGSIRKLACDGSAARARIERRGR